MLSFQIDQHRFNCRAAAIIERDGMVLLHRVEGDDFWTLPGGRVEAGEDAAHTVEREMLEELGIAVTAGPLRCLVENFFEYQSQPNHELGLYFLAQPADPAQLQPGTGMLEGREGHLRLEFAWFTRQQLAQLVVLPGCLYDILLSGDDRFQHIVNRDAPGT
ncbi:ADP-ribose pyrophosphatase YjhB, NUDIX family [Andreprevotia lacus DSM 23236]|jgi:ADP-ribose pyrophosphatase YjhB (NUDIX family)|uniref:ADP-ribose pyrophosphatase YjhB, NUDIX family n=1 Tax=Andreprevotia lacus DSM 23236 TaxID=1121001 RepID=A0A1W1XWJ5_9NEIS|nr:NUDIX domain-containing protein [Andreprevotia lacus]SMC27901.1 ADP-ribose pyrophosphatase YjhB, NUDIX family [Andreprevotia lacus DSM 23236]